MGQDGGPVGPLHTKVGRSSADSLGAATLTDVFRADLSGQPEGVRQRVSRAAGQKVVPHPTVEERERKGRVARAERKSKQLAGWDPPGDRVEFTVRIHDQAGRVVKVLRRARSGQHWDGRDEWGNRLANGVYYYAVTAQWILPDGAPRPSYRTASTRRNTLVISR